jgi:hypothetical protein
VFSCPQGLLAGNSTRVIALEADPFCLSWRSRKEQNLWWREGAAWPLYAEDVPRGPAMDPRRSLSTPPAMQAARIEARTGVSSHESGSTVLHDELDASRSSRTGPRLVECIVMNGTYLSALSMVFFPSRWRSHATNGKTAGRLPRPRLKLTYASARQRHVDHVAKLAGSDSGAAKAEHLKRRADRARNEMKTSSFGKAGRRGRRHQSRWPGSAKPGGGPN